MKLPFFLAAAAAALTIATSSQAQLVWSSYDTSGNRVNANAGAYSAADNGSYTFTIPAGATYTLVTTNFAPIGLAASTTKVVTFSMNATGGFGTSSAAITGRNLALGLFNYGSTAPGAAGSFTDDVGLWLDNNEGSTATSIELFGGTSPLANLLGFASGPKLGGAQGPAAGAVGVPTDGTIIDVTFRVVENASGAGSIGTGTPTTSAGIWLADRATGGTTLSRTAYSATTPSAIGTISLNEFGFQFKNSTTLAVTLVLSNFGGVVPPPIITSQPPSAATASVGSDFTLSVAATGAVSYQWQKSTDGGATFTPITANSTATTASLTLSNVQAADAGVYNVVITNAAGSTTSASSTLTVSSGAVAPTIQTQPANSTILVGASAAFSVVANGTAPLVYQWQKNSNNLTDGATGSGSTISGSGTATLNVANAQLSDTASYRVIITNGAGNITSNAAALTVNQAPFFTTQPVGAVLNPGDSYTLISAASGTPAPTYQWYRNGAAITGATGPSLTRSNVTGADTGNYTVVATNLVSSMASVVASIAVLSSSLNTAAFTPNSAQSPNPDARLSITFNQVVSYGVSGLIRIYDASTNSVVDTVDMVAATNAMNALRANSTVSTMAAPVQAKNISGLNNMDYYPIIISGNTATIYPRNNVLTRGKTYYVAIDPGVFVDASGGAFSGISAVNGTSQWSFATRSSAPASPTALTVAADGTGDFDTVQGALDYVPANNTAPTTIFVRNGSYFEEIYVTAKNAITLLGADRAQTLIFYPNNERFNPSADSLYHRCTMQANRCSNLVIANLSIRNSTPHLGTQAEALLLNNITTSQGIITGVNLYSYQDTIQLNGQTYVSNSYIEGDTDFMWGSGPNFYTGCQLNMLTSGGYFTQIRNPATNHGNVYLNCTLTAASGVTGAFLGRIDPSAFPYSEIVYLNCTMGNFLNTSVAVSGSNYNDGWYQLNGATASTSAPNLHDWDYNTKDASGAALDFSPRAAYAKKLVQPDDTTTISNYSTPSYVLGNGWTPALAPLITAQPTTQAVNDGQSVTFSVGAVGVSVTGADANMALSYQWNKNGRPITGATGATYTIASPAWADAGSYSVTVSNANGSVTSSAANLNLTNDPGVNFVSSYGLDPGTNGAPDADPENDGITNKYEFFLGGIPTQSDRSILPVSSTVPNGSSASLVFEFNRRKIASNMAYAVEYTADLTSGVWSSAASGVNGVTIATSSLDANLDHIKVTIPTTAAKLFARLHL